MPSSAVHSFTDPTTMRERSANQGRADGHRRGRFTAKLIRIDLHGLLAQRYVEKPARIFAFGEYEPGGP